MRYTAVYSNRALKDLAGLGREAERRIVAKIRFFYRSSDPLKHAKSLKGPLAGSYRFRIGEYRVIFELGTGGKIVILYILRVGKRGEIY